MKHVCQHCREPLSPKRLAVLTFMHRGNERTDSYFFCSTCRIYNIKCDYERFSGEPETYFLAPVSQEVGDRHIELIRQCPQPRDEYCECRTHQRWSSGLF